MTLSINKYLGLGLILAGILMVGSLLAIGQQVYAGITYDKPASVDKYLYHDFYPVATTTTATSTNDSKQPANGLVRIDGAKKVDLVYKRGDTTGTGNSGSTTFYPQVSHDGSTWFYFNKFSEFASTTNSGLALALSSGGTTLTGTSTKEVGLILDNHGYRFLRCVAVETTDGEHDCEAAITY